MYPKLILLSDKTVIDTFKSIKTVIEFSSILCDGFKLADSLYEMTFRIEEVISKKSKLQDVVIHKLHRDFYNLSRQIYNLLPRLNNLNYELKNSYDTTKSLKLFDKAFAHTFLDLKIKANAYSDSFLTFETGNLNNFKLNNIGFYDLQYDIAKLKDEYSEYCSELLNNLIPRFDSVIINSSILSPNDNK